MTLKTQEEIFDEYMCAAITGVMSTQKPGDIQDLQGHMRVAFEAAAIGFQNREAVFMAAVGAQNQYAQQQSQQAYTPPPRAFAPQQPMMGPRTIGTAPNGKPITATFQSAPSNCMICGAPIGGPPRPGYESNPDCQKIHHVSGEAHP